MAECHTAKFLQASITIILLRSDGSVVGCGTDDYGECDIEPPEAGTWYVADVPCSRDVVLQAEFVCQDDAMLLVCSGWGRSVALQCTSI